MSQSARVTSIDSIKDFRAALCRFGEDARNGLGAVEMEVRRSLNWITHEQPMFWQMEVKRRKEHVAQAQAEVFRRRLQGGPGREVHDTEQKEILRKAQRGLHEAEAKLEIVRKWIPVYQHAVTEYQARTRPMGDMLESDIRTALALLDRMTTALDAYLAIAAPSGSGGETFVSPASPESVSVEPARPVSQPVPSEQKAAEGETPSPQEGDTAGEAESDGPAIPLASIPIVEP